jgi:hypothetical protein
MLFDLRGRGRRRTVQVIYGMLALLMGAGLVFFGIGGATSGGLLDAIKGNNGSSSSSNSLFQKRMQGLEQQVRVNPGNTAAWAHLTNLRFQVATSGENYDQTNGVYTDKGKSVLRQADQSWQRYLALNPKNPDPTTANLMVQAYGQAGLQNYDRAVQAMEIVVDNRKPTSALYAQLAVLAHAAGQTRKATLSQQKALSLTPKAQRKQLQQAIQTAESQLGAAKTQTTASG